MKIKVGDTVRVLSGDDRNKTGKVMSVDHEKSKVLVEGVNLVYKHVRPSRRNPQGGRLHKEMPVPTSIVSVVCPKTGKPTRIGYRMAADGSKERFARKSGASLGITSPAKASRAKTKAKAKR
jgi:large subunit ribosomal protein L24